MFEQIIDKLGLEMSEYIQWSNKPNNFKMRQLRRKIRYACWAMARGDTKDIPTKFKEYFENEEHFATWELFGVTWDVEREDPSVTTPLEFSHLERWEAKMRQVIPELDGAISYKQGS